MKHLERWFDEDAPNHPSLGSNATPKSEPKEIVHFLLGDGRNGGDET